MKRGNDVIMEGVSSKNGKGLVLTSYECWYLYSDRLIQRSSRIEFFLHNQTVISQYVPMEMVVVGWQ